MKDEELKRLLTECKTIALVGASPNPERASYRVMAYLLGCGYHVIPVNPAQVGHSILGCEVAADLGSITSKIDVVNVFRRSEFIASLYKDIEKLSIQPKLLWLQQMIIDNNVASIASKAGMSVVMDSCLMIEHRRLFLNICS